MYACVYTYSKILTNQVHLPVDFMLLFLLSVPLSINFTVFKFTVMVTGFHRCCWLFSRSRLWFQFYGYSLKIQNKVLYFAFYYLVWCSILPKKCYYKYPLSKSKCFVIKCAVQWTMKFLLGNDQLRSTALKRNIKKVFKKQVVEI